MENVVIRHLRVNLIAMKEKITITIPTPCHEKWEQFMPTAKGGFCGSCQKEVIDFTMWSEEEIKNYFRSGATSTCGRFRSNQLTTYHSDLSTSARQPSRWALPIAFLLVLINRPTEAQTTKTSVAQEQFDPERNFTKGKVDSIPRFILRGEVTDGDSGQFLPGVNIVRKGTTDVTVTDADGKFELLIDQPKAVETIVVSFIGFVTAEQEISVTSASKELKVRLQYDVTGNFDSVIVTGGIESFRWYSPRGLWWKVKRLFR